MSEDNKYTFENKEYRDTYRHTVSHILAQAVKRLYPEVKLAIGPAIENGFYYDFDAPFSFTQEHLDALEAEMRKICKEKEKLERFELPRAEAVKLMQEREEPYKVELINDLPEDATISFYKQGEFTDLCAGPHLDSTGRIKANAFKLTQCCGAYWRGDSKRKMLQRTAVESYLRGEDRQPQTRGGKGLRNYRLTGKTGLVAGAAIVDDTNDVMLIESGGVVLRTPAASINLYGRDTQGVILMRIEQGSRVISVERLAPETDGETAEQEDV